MKRFTALHLSDLHLTKESGHDQQVVLKALFADIEHFVRPRGKIDAIFFTGDLIARGKYETDTYEYVKTEFVDPLLKASGVSNNRLFITPGNHDVDLSKADLLLESIYSSFKTHTEMNALIDSIDARLYYWSHLSSFNGFLAYIEQPAPSLENTLFRSYLFEVNGIKVGIACVNSAWRASGKAGQHDYGKLLIGERQIEVLHKSIASADLRVALIHHPLEWLTTYEKPVVQRAIYKNFDALLHGHNHSADAISLATAASSIFVSNAGCLYQTRDYFNGYSLLEVNMETAQNTWNVTVREYYEQRQVFDVSTRFASDGRNSYGVRRDALPMTLLPTPAYIEVVQEKINSKLLSYAASDVAPKNLHGIFVEPPLSHVSEKQFYSEKNNGEAMQYLSLRELALSDRAIFFMGGRESGKTTLLNYLCLKANDPTYLKNASHSIYVDVSALGKKTRATILEAAVSFCGGEYKRQEVIQLLTEGRIIACFDNLPLNQKETLKLIADFVVEFGKCKYCFAAEEGIEQSLTNDFIPIIGLNADVIYLHSFNRKQTRELVGKWFPDSPSAIQIKVDSILSSIRNLRIPKTPFLISVLLWIKERNINFKPINHSAIIDTFIDGLLEKLTESKDRSNTDSTIKRHYLTELAYAVHKSRKDRWTQHELEKFTIDYFEQKALISSTKPFLNELFNKGILLELGEEICFKFDCFRSFFLAQKIDDSEELTKYALSKEGFLKLGTEIDYCTGLHRNKIEFLKASIKIVEDYRRSLNFKIDLRLFEKIDLENSILSSDDKEVILKNLFGKKPSIQDQEEIFDTMENASPRIIPPSTGRSADQDQAISYEAIPSKAPLIDYFAALTLASMILRNSELVNDAELKHKIYRQLLNLWSEILLSVLLRVESANEHDLRDKQLQEKFPDKDVLTPKYIAKLALPNVIFLLLKESLGTNKLEVIIKDHIHLHSVQIEQLLSTFLYVDLALPGYLIELEKLLETCSKNRYVIELIFFKLLGLYQLKNISDFEGKKVEKLVGDVFILLNDQGSKRNNDTVKSRFITQLQKKEKQFPIKGSHLKPKD